MQIDLFYRFQVPAVCYDAGLYIVNQKQVLGVLYESTPPDAPEFHHLLSLALFQPATKECTDLITMHDTLDETYGTVDALLRYNAVEQSWIITSLININYITLRTLKLKEERYILSPLALSVQDYSEPGLFPLLDTLTNANNITILYVQEADETVETAPGIKQLDMFLSNEWFTLQEPAALIQTGSEIEPVQSWQQWLDRVPQSSSQPLYVQPAQLSLSVHNAELIKTEAIQVERIKELAQADFALTLTHQEKETRLLVLCSREAWLQPQEQVRPRAEQLAAQEWRFWLSGWEPDGIAARWTYASSIGIPVDDQDHSDHPAWPTAHVAAIAGPTTQQGQATFVAALALLKLEDPTQYGEIRDETMGEVLSEMVCLDQTGQVVQKCTSQIGLLPRLALCRETIVGVDRQAGRWRVWNWFVLEHPSFDKVVMLDEDYQRVFVQAESDSLHFWLVAQRASGVSISYRNAETLAEISSATIEQVQLQPDQTEFRPLDGYREKGIIPYQETLLLFVTDDKEEMVCYQIRP